MSQIGSKDIHGNTALMNLFTSTKLDMVKFDNEWFKKLFNAEVSERNNDGRSALMILCKHNTQILNRSYWFIPKLLEYVTMQDNSGNTALKTY